MRKQLFTAGAMLALLLTLSSVFVKAQSLIEAADIPFDFVVGNQFLPAGNYSVRAINQDRNALFIRDRDGKTSALRLTMGIGRPESPGQNKLVFHKYGQRYFLSEVWTVRAGETYGRQLFKSKEEISIQRRLAANRKKHELPQNACETVEILARFVK